MTKAVVFAYHNVGVRCLKVLLSHGVNVALVVTHADSPNERIWFDSVSCTAADYGIPVIAPEDANAPDVLELVTSISPDFIFSFYFRQMLKPGLLASASCGAFNMHGSLLPKYRGRVPVNWAVLQGEKQTGVTLHRMIEKPDAGEIVAQHCIPILSDDTAKEVFDKVTIAAELCLNDALPGLIDGSATLSPVDLTQGSYFGGRKPEDGLINWSKSAQQIHNLIRAVAPPYPGAFSKVLHETLYVYRSLLLGPEVGPYPSPTLFIRGKRLYAQCGDKNILAILSVEYAGQQLDKENFFTVFGSHSVSLR